MHTFVWSLLSPVCLRFIFCFAFHFLKKKLLYSKHLDVTFSTFTDTLTSHSVVRGRGRSLLPSLWSEVLWISQHLGEAVVLRYFSLFADKALLPALQAADGKPSVYGPHQHAHPELQDTMRRLSSNSEERSRLASALSCLKSASEAGNGF